MTEIQESANLVAIAEDPPLSATAPSFDIPSNKYSDIFGLWPPELFDGFEEFVQESRRQSGFGREPPEWW